MQAVPLSQTAPTSASGANGAVAARASDDGFDFFDFLDIINPLQHIPIVSSIYRAITGDEIGSTARLIGGGLYGLGLLGGGWLSLASTAVNVALEEATGDDIAGHVLGFVLGDDEDGAPSTGGDGVNPEDAAVLAAIPRPQSVVVRSTPLADGNQTAMFGHASGGDIADVDLDRLTAGGQPVISPVMSHALMLATQSEDPAIAVALNRALPRGTSRPGQLRAVTPDSVGYDLLDVPVQVEAGVTRARMSSLMSGAIH